MKEEKTQEEKTMVNTMVSPSCKFSELCLTVEGKSITVSDVALTVCRENIKAIINGGG